MITLSEKFEYFQLASSFKKIVKYLLCDLYLAYIIHISIFVLYWIYPDELYYLGWISPDSTLVDVIKMTLEWISDIFPKEKLDISDVSTDINQGPSKELNSIVQICYYFYDKMISNLVLVNFYETISNFVLIMRYMFLHIIWRKTTLLCLTIVTIALIFFEKEWKTRLYGIALIIFVCRVLYGIYSSIPQIWINEYKSKSISTWNTLVHDWDIINAIKKSMFIVPVIQLFIYYYSSFKMYQHYKATEACSGTCGFLRYELIYSMIMTGLTMVASGIFKGITRLFGKFHESWSVIIGLITGGTVLVILGLICFPKNIQSTCEKVT